MASTVAGDAITKPVIQLMKDVIREEDDRQILHSDLRGMETLLLYTDIFFRYQQKDPPEIVKIWLQLLQNSLTEAKGLFDRWRPGQSCLDCVVCKPGRLSKEIREWNALFDQLYHGFQSELFQNIDFSGNAIVSVAVDPLTELLKDVIKEEDNRQILQTDLRRMESLLRDEHTIFQSEKNAHQEIVKWLQSLQTSLTEAKRRLLIDRCKLVLQRQSCTEIREWSASFDKIYHGIQTELSILVTSLQFLSSNPLHIQQKAKEPAVIQPLSREEAWMLFRRVAFKDDQVSMDIQERARRFADECKGMPLAINIVAAMIGQTSVHHWDACFSLMKSVDPSFPPIHPRLDAELYRLLRWSYDALPNSDVKNCFLYCAFYMENQEIDSRDLVQMWIGEGLVKSKQGTYLMDMALGRNYLKLLVDRCFFHIVNESTDVFQGIPSIRSERVHDVIPSVRVHDSIREMAMYIAQKEENCLFMATQNLRNFREIHNNNWRRISVANNFIADLPTDLRCAELVTLILKGNRNLKELPSEFLLSLTSLRVLNLSGCTEISSVPTSIDKLRMLEFLSLSELPIEELPKQICRLSQLQFLDLSYCRRLKSLPSEIGEIQNLKCLNLNGCDSLKIIPREISELTSLSRLVLSGTKLSVETEAALSIWRLKGLKNMTELSVWIGKRQGVEDGIMGTWSEMRHLMLSYSFSQSSREDLLPEDMKSMKKLQSFMLHRYSGYHCLPNCCKFEHLEMVTVEWCIHIRELSPLEWMPNLKLLKLRYCHNLRELGIGSRGGYQRLQKLLLRGLEKLESLGGVSKTEEGEWDEKTVPHLRVVKISRCGSLKRFPIGMEKLSNLCAIKGSRDWWRDIRWENDNIKSKLEKYFQPYYYL